jgi:hypothetical protein
VGGPAARLCAGFEVPAFSGSARKHLLSTPKFYFFDLGVRHAAAGLEPTRDTVLAHPGPLLEQWVAVEIHKRLGYSGGGRLSYYRTKAGAEVDFTVEIGRRLVPMDVKWTDDPRREAARHLIAFLTDHPRARNAYLVCRCERPAADSGGRGRDSVVAALTSGPSPVTVPHAAGHATFPSTSLRLSRRRMSERRPRVVSGM